VAHVVTRGGEVTKGLFVGRGRKVVEQGSSNALREGSLQGQIQGKWLIEFSEEVERWGVRNHVVKDNTPRLVMGTMTGLGGTGRS